MFRCENLMLSVLIVVAILFISGYQIKVAFSQDEETPNFGTEKAPFIPLPEKDRNPTQDEETPNFGTEKAPFIPLPEKDRNPPPPATNATIVKDLPKNMFVRDNDSDTEPLSITNRTEILEVLPANSTTAIDFVDKSLKNSTGQGLLPPSILSNISKAEKLENISKPSNGNQTSGTLLDILNQENLTQKVLPLIEPTNKSTTSADLEELDQPLPPNVPENVTTLEEEEENQTAPSSVNGNATAENENETSQETAQPEVNQSAESPPAAKELGSQLPQIQNNTQNEGNEEKPSKSLTKNQQSEDNEEKPPISLTTNNTQNEGNEEKPSKSLTKNQQSEDNEEKPPISLTTNNTQNEGNEEKPSKSLTKNQQSEDNEEKPPISLTTNNTQNEGNEEKPSKSLTKNQQSEDNEEKPPISLTTNNTQNEGNEEKPPVNLTTNNTQNDFELPK